MVTLDALEMRSATVADIALKVPQAIDILNRYNLDYCCNGKKSFMEVCRKANLIPENVWDEIMEKKSLPATDVRIKFTQWEPALLIDFIVQHHHAYVRESIPQIQQLLDKVCSVHSTEHPELFDIQNSFTEVAEELLNHLPKEEVILFPAIRRITDTATRIQENTILLNNMEESVSVMEEEHETVGSLIKLIRSLTNQYTPPAHACLSFQHIYKLLKGFDTDLMQHIHLENNILFPMVKSA